MREKILELIAKLESSALSRYDLVQETIADLRALLEAETTMESVLKDDGNVLGEVDVLLSKFIEDLGQVHDKIHSLHSLEAASA